MKKAVALFLIAVILSAALFLSITANAAASSSIQFNAQKLYKVSKSYSQAPNTFEAVVNFPANTNLGTRGGVILGNYGSGNPNVSFEVFSGGNPRLYITDASGTVTNLVFNSVNLFTGLDTHVAIVRDASQQKVFCYINGELKETLDCTYTSNISTGAPLVLGGDHRNGNEQYFKGSILSVAIYSSARSASKIQSDYSNGFSLESDMIAWYDTTDLNDVNTVPDLSQNGYDISYKSPWISEKEPVSNYAYSFAVVGDTQIVARHYPDKFHKIYDYILDNAEQKNIQFVMGLGDITDADTDAEWALATENISRLDGEIPYSVVRGNHDSKSKFNSAFPYSSYSDVILDTYDGTMLNACQELTVGEIKYLIFTLDYGASVSVLKWAERIIGSHPKHNVIITTHAYLYRDGTTLDSTDVCPPASTGGVSNGDHMWEILIKQHENIVMVISGHDPCDNIVMAQDKGVKGNTVTQLLIDPQGVDAALGGVGLVALLHFSEDGKNVTVEYYSTINEKYFMEENQFSFTLDLAGDATDTSNTDNDQSSSNETNTDNASTDKQTNTEESATDANANNNQPSQSKGCGASVSCGLLVLIPCTAIASVCVRKKRKN